MNNILGVAKKILTKDVYNIVQGALRFDPEKRLGLKQIIEACQTTYTELNRELVEQHAEISPWHSKTSID